MPLNFPDLNLYTPHPCFQTPRNNSESEILNALAIFSILTNDRLRSPHSIPPI